MTNTTTSVNITELELIDITDMSSAAIQEMFDASRRKAGDNVMLQVLDLLEYGRSQTLTAEHLQVIKSYVDEMLGCWSVKAGWEVQTLPQQLPLTESGQLNIMSNYKAFSLAVSGVVATMAIVCHLGVQALDKATAEQCKTHAWPQAAHQIHMDWCADNGYATNWVRKHGTGRCKSSLSYYHLTRVVNSTTYQHHGSHI